MHMRVQVVLGIALLSVTPGNEASVLEYLWEPYFVIVDEGVSC